MDQRGDEGVNCVVGRWWQAKREQDNKAIGREQMVFITTKRMIK
jgi:hypothetical protein